MTTQKLFKRRVRERMSKTGESYTAARLHVVPTRDRIEIGSYQPGERHGARLGREAHRGHRTRLGRVAFHPRPLGRTGPEAPGDRGDT